MGFKYNKEKDRIEITGRIIKCKLDYLTKYVGGKQQRIGDAPVYQFAIVTDAPDPSFTDTIRNTYYAKSSDDYTPKWLIGKAETDDNGHIIINLKSKYDIKYFAPVEGEMTAYNSLDDFNKVHDNPLGSIVTASVQCKEGAMYIKALRFDKISSVTADSYFD